MPRDTIRRFSLDLERILVAGAHLAAADPDLAKDAAALSSLATQLGAKAPVISQLAAAAEKAVASHGSDAARDVISVATMTAQVRAAQAHLAPVPALTQLPAQPEIGTPCNSKELGELYAALIDSGKGRLERVKLSIERGDIADLRLVDALIFAMNDGYIGDLIADQAVPRLGAAIVAPIRATIQFDKSRTLDARKLRAVVAADRAGSRDLLTRALNEGNAELREAALHAIADHIRGDAEFEQQILTMIAKERSDGVFRAALRALAGYASDAALQALTAALDDTRTIQAAAEGLSHSRHPQALAWMLKRLDSAVVAAAQAAKTSTTIAASAPASYAVEPEHMASILLYAMSNHHDAHIADAAMPLIGTYGKAAAHAALRSANPQQLIALAQLLSGSDPELFAVAAEATAQLPADRAFKQQSAAFAAKDRETAVGLARIKAVVEQVMHRETMDARWAPLALKQLGGAESIALQVIPLLGKCKEAKAVKPLLRLLKHQESELVAAACSALGSIGDSTVLPALLALFQHQEWLVRWAAHNAIVALSDAATVDQVRTAVVQANGNEDWHLRTLLRALERRHPGK